MLSSDTDRIERVKRSISENNIDLMILQLSENVLFLSGYWPLNGFSFLVFSSENDPVLIVPESEKEYAERSWVKDIRLFGWGKVNDIDPYISISTHLKDLLNKNIMKHLKIGYEGSFESIAPSHMGAEVYTSDRWMKTLSETFSNIEFIDATSLINRERATKTKREIGKIKLTNEIACLGLHEFLTNCIKGIKETELESKVYSAIHNKGMQYKDVTSVSCWPNIMSGKKTASSYRLYLISEEKPLREGDIVILELATVVDGYWSDLTRTAIVGKANEKQIEVYGVVERAQKAAIQKIRQGVPDREVDNEARELIKSSGYGDNFVHITGHGVGFKYHEPYPCLSPNSKGILQEGMITTVEPGIYIEDFGGIRIEDDIVVTDEGFEYLSDLKHSLQ